MSVLVSDDPSEIDAPQLQLRVVGDGRAFCRAIVRATVRRELISLGLIPDPRDCEPAALAR